MLYPENADFLAAIIARPEDDAPRLIYADWLEEHGDPDRAVFIRVQCGLWEKAPTDSDYFALLERRKEVCLGMLRRWFLPKITAGVRFYDRPDQVGDTQQIGYHRGFPYFVHVADGHTFGVIWDLQRFAEGFRAAVEQTTLRGLYLEDQYTPHLATILHSPASRQLSALGLELREQTRNEPRSCVEVFLSTPLPNDLRWLNLRSLTSTNDVAKLAQSESFHQLKRFEAYLLQCEERPLENLFESFWFGRLKRIRLGLSAENAPAAQLLARLSNLEILELSDLPPTGFVAFGPQQLYSTLGSLTVSGQLHGEGCTQISRTRLPSLVALDLTGGIQNSDLQQLLRAKWFGQLRSLTLSSEKISDDGVFALAANSCAQQLRILRLGNQPLGKAGLLALAKEGNFPNLTTLDLGSSRKGKVRPNDVRDFLDEFSSPNLRFLNLSGWPLDDSGAFALAANPAFANLTSLNLGFTKISETGLLALLGSPHLQNLMELQLPSTFTGPTAGALNEPSVLPNLRLCELSELERAEAVRIQKNRTKLVI